jgi:NADH dehydrogenase
MSDRKDGSKQHVVVVGGGFGGLETAKRLSGANVRVTLIDRQNYHLFQPLLYQVATGGLSPANIATPLRFILGRQKNCEVQMAEVTDFDLERNCVILADGELPFDTLVLSAGSTHSYFGRDDWEPLAPGLKTLTDAANVRRRIYKAFEAAEREPDPQVRAALMTFVVVGAGPTGVELAGALAEIAQYTLRNDFRHIDPEDARILLVEAGAKVLSNYPEELCERAASKIRQLGIEIHTHTKMVEVTESYVRLATADAETTVPTRTVLWAAGVRASSLGGKLAKACGIDTNRGGQIPVNQTLNIDGRDNIYVIGDIAAATDADGNRLPGLAAVAVQQGAYVAKAIARRSQGQPIKKPFRYKNKGTMATIGRAAAVAEIGKYQFSGLFAWLLWLFVHLMLIVQFQNRVLILLQWGWNYTTFNRSARLITGEDNAVLVNAAKKSASERLAVTTTPTRQQESSGATA